MSADIWLAIIAAANVLVTGIIAYFAWRTTQTNERLEALNKNLGWLTGAMEAQSTMMVRLEAKKQDIKIIWWDPEVEPWPKTGPHGTEAQIDVIRLGMHRRDRSGTK